MRDRRRIISRLLGAVGVLMVSLSLAGSSHRQLCPYPMEEIFQGITYGCELITPGPEGNGHLYWARVDLMAPGIELYVTPLDPAALSQGWQYRLKWIADVVRQEGLSVAINGTLFTSDSRWRLRLPGDLAKSAETVVANHVVSHIWEHTYLLWFDDLLTPHLETTKPPNVKVLRMAKWGIGGQGVGLRNGTLSPGNSQSPDSRTAVGIDASRKLLFLAVGEKISPRLILEKLADLGAKDGMLLDGGGSSSMAIATGPRAPSGVLHGGWRPVATHFGVRARPL